MPKYSLNRSSCSLQPGVGVQEEHALLLQVLADLVVDHLGLVLRGHTGDEALLLRLGDAQPVVGVLDVLGQVLPAGRLLLGRADEVLDVVEVDPGQVGAPRRHRLAVEQPQALQAQVEHPLGSFFFAEMSRTTSSLRPRRAPAPAVSSRPSRTRTGRGRRAAPPGSGSSLLGHRCPSRWCGLDVRAPCRDVRGAHPVAVGDRGQALHVRADQARDHLGLGLAQLGELGGDVRHRAVVLAQLPAGRDRRRRGSVALGGQRLGERLGPASGSSPASPWRPGSAPPARRPGRPRTPATASPPFWEIQRSAAVARSSYVCGPQRTRPASVSAKTLAGRPRPALAVDVLLAGDHVAVGEHRVEVPADRRRAEPERLAQLGGGRRALLQQERLDPGRARLSPPSPRQPGRLARVFTTATLRKSSPGCKQPLW